MLNKVKTYQRNSTRQVGKNNYYSLLIVINYYFCDLHIVINSYMKT